jgi:hypothetical protein
MKDVFLFSLADRFGIMGQNAKILTPMIELWGEWGDTVASG